jgi:hypothetical protein
VNIFWYLALIVPCLRGERGEYFAKTNRNNSIFIKINPVFGGCPY